MSPRTPQKSQSGNLAKIVAEARRNQELRQIGYREKALKIYPPICGRCGREFSGKRLRELTVHHKDHNHDNNPPDGSNWELLCIYCHDMEHQKYLNEEDYDAQTTGDKPESASIHRPFADLRDLLKQEK